MNKSRRIHFGDFDWATVLLMLVLMLIGWLSIYSAIYEEGIGIFDRQYRSGKQLVWIGFALLLLLVVFIMNFRTFAALAVPIYILVMLLLIAVLFFGVEVNGAKSWFYVGNFHLQPAEFAKFATALALAHVISRYDFEMSRASWRWICLAVILLPTTLIILQNDIGSALVFLAFILVLYREGLPGIYLTAAFLAIVITLLSIVFGVKYVALGGLILGLTYVFVKWSERSKRLLPALIFVAFVALFSLLVDFAYDSLLGDYQKNRIEIVLGLKEDFKDQGYNLHQSLIAIGSGGFFGKGYLNGTQTKFDFVPEQSTDFIFCTIGEEFGFLGSTLLIVLYIGLLFRIIQISERQAIPFARVYGYGIASVLFVHLLINVGMTLGLIPVIGIPLPFLSYGGSSLWANVLMIAILLRFDSARRILLK